MGLQEISHEIQRLQAFLHRHQHAIEAVTWAGFIFQAGRAHVETDAVKAEQMWRSLQQSMARHFVQQNMHRQMEEFRRDHL